MIDAQIVEYGQLEQRESQPKNSSSNTHRTSIQKRGQRPKIDEESKSAGDTSSVLSEEVRFEENLQLLKGDFRKLNSIKIKRKEFQNANSYLMTSCLRISDS